MSDMKTIVLNPLEGDPKNLLRPGAPVIFRKGPSYPWEYAWVVGQWTMRGQTRENRAVTDCPVVANENGGPYQAMRSQCRLLIARDDESVPEGLDRLCRASRRENKLPMHYGGPISWARRQIEDCPELGTVEYIDMNPPSRVCSHCDGPCKREHLPKCMDCNACIGPNEVICMGCAVRGQIKNGVISG